MVRTRFAIYSESVGRYERRSGQGCRASLSGSAPLLRDRPIPERDVFEAREALILRNPAPAGPLANGCLRTRFRAFPFDKHTNQGGADARVHRILHPLKLRAQSRQFGGHAQGAIPRRRHRDDPVRRWPVRSRRRWPARVLQGRHRPAPNPRGGRVGDRGGVTTSKRHAGVSTPISGAAATKWRTFQVRMVAAPAFTAHVAMSMSYVCPPITPRP